MEFRIAQAWEIALPRGELAAALDRLIAFFDLENPPSIGNLEALLCDDRALLLVAAHSRTRPGPHPPHRGRHLAGVGDNGTGTYV
jgi:hypothetical protein